MNQCFIAIPLQYYRRGKEKSNFIGWTWCRKFSSLRNLVTLAKQSEKAYSKLIKMMNKDQNLKFMLLNLPEYCNFGFSEEDIIWDWLTCGVRNPKIHQRLLAKIDLSYDKA